MSMSHKKLFVKLELIYVLDSLVYQSQLYQRPLFQNILVSEHVIYTSCQFQIVDFECALKMLDNRK